MIRADKRKVNRKVSCRSINDVEAHAVEKKVVKITFLAKSIKLARPLKENSSNYSYPSKKELTVPPPKKPVLLPENHLLA